nr:MAG: hypothetical protein [Bacteriophage sp.]
MPRKDKVIHISNLPSTFRGNVTRNGRFIQNGIPPLGGAYDKVAKSTGLIRLGNEFLYNGVNNLVSKDNREKLMNNTAGRLINYVKDFNKESLPSDDELGPTFPFNIIQTTRSNGRNLPQKQYAVGGKIPNVVAGGIAKPLGNNFFYMNGRKHSQGGIDIGPSDKTGIEVEDGEVVETNGNELKVYSAQPIINGISPARLVMGGANPNKVFQAQENFKDRNGINDDGTKAQYGITKEGEGLFDKIDNYANIAEKTLAIPNMATSAATLLAPNPYTAIASYITGLGGAAIDVYQLSRALYKKDYPNVAKNAIDIGTSIIGLRALRNAKKLRELDKVLRTSGADREIVRKTIGRTTKTKRTMYMTKEANKASNYEAVGYTTIPFSGALNLVDTDDANNKKKRMGGDDIQDDGKGGLIDMSNPKNYKNYYPGFPKTKRMGGLSRSKDYGSKSKPYPKVKSEYFAGGHRSYPIPTKADAIDALRLAGLHGRSDVKAKVYNKYPELRKKGSNGLIVSISGNVKNGLLHSPSSTGGLRDKFAVGGKQINRHGRTWEYDEQIGAYVPITNRTINRTSAYPINKSARGETVVGSNYTFRNGRWSKNNNVNTNNNKPNIDNGNRCPQYYAECRLPLFEDGAGITSGLVGAGWSHGNDKDVSMNNTNISSLSATKSSGKTPRGGRSKSSQSTQSISTKTPPTAVYNRNLPKIEASIPTTLPVFTSTPAQGTKYSDGKGQGKFKNLTTADWIGLGSNVVGGLASYFASKRAINKMRGPGQPTLISANKLKTKYNINPQLDRIREDKFEAYRDIDSNTASSRVSLARKQRVRNAAGQAANELYGNKENIETNLINQDRRNQQSVRQFNAQQYNQYIDRKAAFDNGIREAKVTNINNLFSGINAGIQDMISRYENRKALNNVIGTMRASAPNVDDRIMRDAGVDYDEFIIRKSRKLGGKQSCR